MPGAGRPGRLLLTIHHLAVDGVSWRILVPDLAAAWQAVAARARRPRCRRAARRSGAGRSGLRRMRRTPGGVAELPFWRGDAGRRRRCRWPTARSIRRATRPARAGHLTLTLPAAVTEALLTRVPAAFHGGINDVLLTGAGACGGGLVRRRRRAGGRGPRRKPRGAARPRGPWPRGDASSGARPVADGGLVHQPVPGAARSGPARSRRGAGGRRGARPGAQDASRSSCARCRTTGWAMGCCAISTGGRRRQLAGAAGAAARLQLSGPVRAPGGGLGADWPAAGASGRGSWRRRRRSGDAAGASARGQCADAGRRGRARG